MYKQKFKGETKMQKTYVEERRNDILYRTSLGILLAIILWAISNLLGIPHLTLTDGIITNLILVFCAEFSFEFKESKWKFKIRSSGKSYYLSGIFVVLYIIWPFVKLSSLLGKENKPIMAYIAAAIYLYGMLFKDWQMFDGIYHLAVLYILYKNRKTNK